MQLTQCALRRLSDRQALSISTNDAALAARVGSAMAGTGGAGGVVGGVGGLGQVGVQVLRVGAY